MDLSTSEGLMDGPLHTHLLPPSRLGRHTASSPQRLPEARQATVIRAMDHPLVLLSPSSPLDIAANCPPPPGEALDLPLDTIQLR